MRIITYQEATIGAAVLSKKLGNTAIVYVYRVDTPDGESFEWGYTSDESYLDSFEFEGLQGQVYDGFCNGEITE